MQEQNILSLLDQIRAIAQEGLKFHETPYDKARYERMLKLAAQNYAPLLQMPDDIILQKLQQQIDIITPKLGADAAVIDEQNRLLILKRSDDGSWCLPCGWVDVGESATEAAVREVHEETGLTVKPLSILQVGQKNPNPQTNLRHLVFVLTLMEKVPVNAPVIISHEHTAFRWIDHAEDLHWHCGHDQAVKLIFDFLQGISKGKIDL